MAPSKCKQYDKKVEIQPKDNDNDQCTCRCNDLKIESSNKKEGQLRLA